MSEKETGFSPDVIQLLSKLTPEMLSAIMEATQDRSTTDAAGYSRLDIMQSLAHDKNGNTICSIDNLLYIMRNDPDARPLRYNLLKRGPEHVAGDDVRPWTDADDAALRRTMERHYHLNNISRLKQEDAFNLICTEREYDPIIEMIERTEWDGEEHIKYFFQTVADCEDNEYTSECARLIFAGGIHRTYNPGSKFDDVIVLVGEQGSGKSSLVRMLALDDAYFGEINTFDYKAGEEAISGKWICEIPELLALKSQKRAEGVKAFISAQAPHFRGAYERRAKELPRRCVFVGTTNEDTFLDDLTGSRRWYPLRVQCDGEYINDHADDVRAEIAQCWAEMRAAYLQDPFHGKARPTANRALKEAINERREAATIEDVRVGEIKDQLERNARIEQICVLQIWRDCLKYPESSRPTRAESNEIAAILTHKLQWVNTGKVKYFCLQGYQKTWMRPGSKK